MSDFNTSFHNQADYYISSALGRRKIIEPEGWKSDFMEIKKSKENSGVVNKASTNLKFIGNGEEEITKIKDELGTEADAVLEKWSMHPRELKQIKAYRAQLDIGEYKLKKGKVQVKAQESGLLSKIATYKSEKVELERLDSFNGNPLQPLQKHSVAVDGKRIFKKSLLETDPTANFTDVWRMSDNDGDYETRMLPVPVIRTHISDVNVYIPSPNKFDHGSMVTGDAGNLFYTYNNIDKDLNIDIRVACKITEIDINDIANGFFKIRLIRYGGGDSLNYLEHWTLYSENNIYSLGGQEIDVSLSKTITLLEDESLALVFYGGGEFGDFFNDGDFKIDISDIDASINIEEDSVFRASNNQILLPYERLERLLQIMTGRTDKDLLRSSVFGRKDLGHAEDGELAYLGSSTGFWARGFDEQNFTTSWKDTMQTYFAVRGISWGVERRGDLETIVVEPLTYFYQIGEVFTFPNQVKNVERKIANEFQYSSIDIGYEKGGGDYEEAVGLDEPNGKHNYTTPFVRNEKKHSLLSKDRADMTGYEYARRKPKESYPNEDTRYDIYIFLMDCKVVDGYIVQKKWTDLFIKKPYGIYSVETATNLDLTPKRNLQHHGWWLNGGLFRYNTQKLVYGSSEFPNNSQMVSQKEGEIEVYEQGNLPITSLDAPRFKTEWVTFQHKIDFDLNELINGYTDVGGRLIPNIYFEWRFLNEDGVYEKCRIFEVKPKGSGKIKVLKV